MAERFIALYYFHSVFVHGFVKVAEHSFQVPMPNSLFLLNHVCFGARFLQESR